MANVTYYMHPEVRDEYIEPTIYSMMNSLGLHLATNSKVIVFPETMLKPPGLPNGLAVVSPLNESILLPTLLRDPGCGFLLFKIKITDKITPRWHHEIGAALHEQLHINKPTIPLSSNILFTGLKSCGSTDINKFSNIHFNVSHKKINLTTQEKEQLSYDFGKLTNTMEIKKYILIPKK